MKYLGILGESSDVKHAWDLVSVNKLHLNKISRVFLTTNLGREKYTNFR